VPVLAVDGGGSKVDAVLLSRDGRIVSAARVSNQSPDGRSPRDDLETVQVAVTEVLERAGVGRGRRPLPRVGMYCLAGADLPQDDRRIMRWLSRQGWTREIVLRNDTFAVLRAGTERSWGVGIVCGFGTNCSAISPDGREYRLPAIGDLSGDWGGGTDIGPTALWHAMRAQDGRGERTSLVKLVPEHFGMKRPRQVMEAVYFERMARERLVELTPVVFRAARDGDRVARSLVDRQADEIATMAIAAIRKLRMVDLDVDVVLGGGIFNNRLPAFFERLSEGVAGVVPRARMVVLKTPPVVGAALLALDHTGAPKAAYQRVRDGLTHEHLGGRLANLGRKGPRWPASSSRA
jgi:N-acetylglucosamine kinase-like BadF-type ATPase